MEALLRLLRVALVVSVVAHFSLVAKSSSFSLQEFHIVNVESRVRLAAKKKESYGVFFQMVCTFIIKNNVL
ncbi:hypothetical protein CsSME_00028420 [Camellia sinensis var. sinensis]